MPDLRGETLMKLVSGERFRLSDENKYIRMVSGIIMHRPNTIRKVRAHLSSRSLAATVLTML